MQEGLSEWLSTSISMVILPKILSPWQYHKSGYILSKYPVQRCIHKTSKQKTHPQTEQAFYDAVELIWL